MHVAVEKSGGETATARIAQILNDTAGCKLAFQHRGEQVADRAVIPTLAVGGLAWATIGSEEAVAALNSDLGIGIRMAAPLGMLRHWPSVRGRASSPRMWGIWSRGVGRLPSPGIQRMLCS
jgi:predicted flavoprotein YhiN